jgi:hypothetical protein
MRITAPPPKRSGAATSWGISPTTTLELVNPVPNKAIVMSRYEYGATPVC